MDPGVWKLRHFGTIVPVSGGLGKDLSRGVGPVVVAEWRSRSQAAPAGLVARANRDEPSGVRFSSAGTPSASETVSRKKSCKFRVFPNYTHVNCGICRVPVFAENAHRPVLGPGTLVNGKSAGYNKRFLASFPALRCSETFALCLSGIDRSAPSLCQRS